MEQFLNGWLDAMCNMTCFNAEKTEDRLEIFLAHKKMWLRLYEDFSNIVSTLPQQNRTPADFTGAMAEEITALLDIYNDWVNNVPKAGEKLRSLAADMIIDKTVPVGECIDGVVEVISTTHCDISERLIRVVKSTPFGHLLELIDTLTLMIQEITDSSSEESDRKSTLRAQYEKVYASYFTTITTATISIAETAGTLSFSHLRDVIAMNSLKKKLHMYAEGTKITISQLLPPLSTVPSKDGEMLSVLTKWAHAHFDLLDAWFTMVLGLAEGLGKSSTELYRFAYDTFIWEKVTTAEEFEENWSYFYHSVVADLAEDTRFFGILPTYVNSLSHYLDTTNIVYSVVRETASAQRKYAKGHRQDRQAEKRFSTARSEVYTHRNGGAMLHPLGDRWVKGGNHPPLVLTAGKRDFAVAGGTVHSSGPMTPRSRKSTTKPS